MVAFLQHPGIAVGIAEIGEARVISAARIGAWKKAPAPATVGVLVADLAHGHSAIGQFQAGRKPRTALSSHLPSRCFPEHLIGLESSVNTMWNDGLAGLEL